MDLIRIQPDKERTKSIMKMAEIRFRTLGSYKREEEVSLLAEGLYEVSKELVTALLFLDGYKTLSHTDLVEYRRANYKQHFTEYELGVFDEYRKNRNRIVYYGFFVEPSFVKRTKPVMEALIKKLKGICENKL
jgi:hypothetical protein